MRYTWQQIEQMYPDQWVLMKELEFVNGDIKSAEVIYTAKLRDDIYLFEEKNQEAVRNVTLMDTKIIYDLPEIKRRLEPVFIYSGVKSAILFGSYAQGQATKDSDIDILVDSGLRGLDFVGLIEYVREALQKDVDLIDVNHVEFNSPISKKVADTGVVIYGG